MINVSRLNSYIDIRVTGDSIHNFRELVQRATNLWPDAAPEIKSFADQITNPDILKGKESLQEYQKQDTSPKKRIRTNFVCGSCHSDNLIDLQANARFAEFHCSHCKAANFFHF